MRITQANSKTEVVIVEVAGPFKHVKKKWEVFFPGRQGRHTLTKSGRGWTWVASSGTSGVETTRVRALYKLEAAVKWGLKNFS